MSKRSHKILIFIGILAVSIISACFGGVWAAKCYKAAQFELLGNISQGLIHNQFQAFEIVLEILKEYKTSPENKQQENILSYYGYTPSDFVKPLKQGKEILAIGLLLSCFLVFLGFWYQRRTYLLRIRKLTSYLEKVNAGADKLLFEAEEDEFSHLQDELYKTVTMLHQTSNAALKAKNSYADNLSNIAHQLKTPITAISLSIQMEKENPSQECLKQIQKQLNRLTHLEEALLVLSRIDTGVLTLEQKPVDIFTVLSLAADNLEELLLQAEVEIIIPELEVVTILGDMEWLMEALMNLLKNCMEHTPVGGKIHCFYEQNPLYTEICIWDEGTGFAKEDLPYIFKRFYCGKNEREGGIGIGLSLSKELIAMQNGVISAKNMPQGGACFEIHFPVFTAEQKALITNT